LVVRDSNGCALNSNIPRIVDRLIGYSVNPAAAGPTASGLR